MTEMSESAVRHLAKRHGFIVRRSRTRNPDAVDYGGYMLAKNRNALVIGRDYDRNLDDIVHWPENPECAMARRRHGGQ